MCLIVLFILENLSKKFGTEINDLWDNFGSDFTYPGNLPAYVEEYFEEQDSKFGNSEHLAGKIQCLPLPGTNVFINRNQEYPL